MHIFDALLRSVIQAVVMAVWGVFTLAFLAGMIGRIILFLWKKLHPVRAIVHIENHDVIDAEWVREL